MCECCVFFIYAATETAQQLKKTAGVPFHAKGRGLVKKIDTTSELDNAVSPFLLLYSLVCSHGKLTILLFDLHTSTTEGDPQSSIPQPHCTQYVPFQ